MENAQVAGMVFLVGRGSEQSEDPMDTILNELVVISVENTRGIPLNGFQKDGFSIIKWFPLISLNHKMVSIKFSQSKNGSHSVVLNHFMVLISWFPSHL